MRNPYIAGAPVRGKQGFYGRQDILDWAIRELSNPNNNALVLFGQRRIGKTTLLLQLQKNLPSDAFLPIYIDLHHSPIRSLGHVLSDWADSAAEKTNINVPDISMFDDQGFFFRKTFLPQLYEAIGPEKRPIFLLDEFDVLDHVAEEKLHPEAAAKSLFPFLQQLMIEDPHPGFVFVVGRRAEDLSINFMSTFKASSVREVWVLDRESTEAVIRQGEKSGNLHFSEESIDRIFALTNGHPYLTQLLCQRLWEQKPDQIDMNQDVGISDIEAVINDALETGHHALSWLWDGLSPAEKIYSSAMAEIEIKDQGIAESVILQILKDNAIRLSTGDVQLAPQHLVKRRILSQFGENQYQFSVELLRLWISQNKPLREMKDELDRKDSLADQSFEIAQGFSKRQKWEIAIRNYRDTLDIHPRHFRARLNLGEALLEIGSFDESAIELERAYEIDRTESRLLLVRALTSRAKQLLIQGDRDSALSICSRIFQLTPNEPDAQEIQNTIWAQRGDEALHEGDLETAVIAFENVGDKEKIAETKSLQRQKLLETHQFETAIKQYKDDGKWPSFPEELIAIAENWDEDQKLDVYKLILDNFSENTKALQNQKKIWKHRGDIAFEREDYHSALNAYRIAEDNENIHKADKAYRYRQIKKLTRTIKNFSKERKWAEAITLAEEIVLISDDVQTQAEWRSNILNFQNEALLEKQFIDAQTALNNKEWKRAQYKFAEIILVSPAYNYNGTLAAEALLKTIRESVGNLKITPEKAHRLAPIISFRVGYHNDKSYNRVLYSPNGNFFGVSADDQNAKPLLFDGKSLNFVKNFPANHTIIGITDDIMIFGVGQDLYAVNTTTLEKIWEKGGFGTRAVLLSALKVIALATGDNRSENRLDMYEINNLSLLKTIKLSRDISTASGSFNMAVSTTATFASFSYNDLYLTQLKTGVVTQLTDIGFSSPTIHTLAFSPDGSVLATLDEEAVQIRDSKDGHLIRSFDSNFSESSHGLAFSPDGRILAAAFKKCITLWNTENFEVINNIKTNTKTLTFSPDGMRLVSLSLDNRLTFWEIR